MLFPRYLNQLTPLTPIFSQRSVRYLTCASLQRHFASRTVTRLPPTEHSYYFSLVLRSLNQARTSLSITARLRDKKMKPLRTHFKTTRSDNICSKSPRKSHTSECLKLFFLLMLFLDSVQSERRWEPLINWAGFLLGSKIIHPLVFKWNRPSWYRVWHIIFITQFLTTRNLLTEGCTKSWKKTTNRTYSTFAPCLAKFRRKPPMHRGSRPIWSRLNLTCWQSLGPGRQIENRSRQAGEL